MYNNCHADIMVSKYVTATPGLWYVCFTFILNSLAVLSAAAASAEGVASAAGARQERAGVVIAKRSCAVCLSAGHRYARSRLQQAHESHVIRGRLVFRRLASALYSHCVTFSR